MYKKEIELQDNEIPAIVNAETGELTLLKSRKSNIAKGKSVFVISEFSKLNKQAIPVLKEIFNHIELSIIIQMIGLSEYGTNSLRPLNNETTMKELSETFNVGKNQINKYLKHLFDVGVYAQFKISKYGVKEYWVLNPYISFSGKIIEDSVFLNFQNTEITDKILSCPS